MTEGDPGGGGGWYRNAARRGARNDEDAGTREERLRAARIKGIAHKRKMEIEKARRERGKQEQNYILFKNKVPNGYTPRDLVAEMMLAVGIDFEKIVSICINPDSNSTVEVLLRSDVVVDIEQMNQILAGSGFQYDINSIGYKSEVVHVRKLNLTAHPALVAEQIKEAVSPFVHKVLDVIPTTWNILPRDRGAPFYNFYNGKLDGNYRVIFEPKEEQVIPGFIPVGPEKVRGEVKYSRGDDKNQLCHHCFKDDHLSWDEICTGGEGWNAYVDEFYQRAAELNDEFEVPRTETQDFEAVVKQREEEIKRWKEVAENMGAEKEDVRVRMEKQVEDVLKEFHKLKAEMRIMETKHQEEKDKLCEEAILEINQIRLNKKGTSTDPEIMDAQVLQDRFRLAEWEGIHKESREKMKKLEEKYKEQTERLRRVEGLRLKEQNKVIQQTEKYEKILREREEELETAKKANTTAPHKPEENEVRQEADKTDEDEIDEVEPEEVFEEVEENKNEEVQEVENANEEETDEAEPAEVIEEVEENGNEEVHEVENVEVGGEEEEASKEQSGEKDLTKDPLTQTMDMDLETMEENVLDSVIKTPIVTKPIRNLIGLKCRGRLSNKKKEDWCAPCRAKKKCVVDWKRIDEDNAKGEKRKFLKDSIKESPPEKTRNKGVPRDENDEEKEMIMPSQEIDQDEVNFGAASSSSPIRDEDLKTGNSNGVDSKLQESLSVPSLQASLIGGGSLSDTNSERSKSAAAECIEEVLNRADELEAQIVRIRRDSIGSLSGFSQEKVAEGN